MLKIGLVGFALVGMSLMHSGKAETLDETIDGTLEQVRQRGWVNCGVTQGLEGFSKRNQQGNWEGLDVELCRAVAAATLGDAEQVDYFPLSAKARFSALQSGKIDILSRVTTWTLTREAKLGLRFAGINMYDGQGFMVRKDLGANSARELNGASICSNSSNSTLANVADFFKLNGMEYTPVIFEKSSEVLRAYDQGRCDVYTSDKSGLAAQRLQLKEPDQHVLLPDTISKEPLGPVVRSGDEQWFDIVRWTLNAVIEAEFLGITSSNASELKEFGVMQQKRLLGSEGDFGSAMGLNADWAFTIITQVGNYSEIYERTVGSQSPLGIARGLNAQWNNGGILYSQPIK